MSMSCHCPETGHRRDCGHFYEAPPSAPADLEFTRVSGYSHTCRCGKYAKDHPLTYGGGFRTLCNGKVVKT